MYGNPQVTSYLKAKAFLLRQKQVKDAGLDHIYPNWKGKLWPEHSGMEKKSKVSKLEKKNQNYFCPQIAIWYIESFKEV